MLSKQDELTCLASISKNKGSFIRLNLKILLVLRVS